MNGWKVLMAMSGGIDSTVAAILLQEQGYELIGVTYRTYDTISQGCTENKHTDAIVEAKQMAERLCFEHHILDLRDEFKSSVIRNFIDEYLRGRTPNPCIICNSEIKWGKLLETADAFGCQYIATGHYARIGYENNRYFLRKGIDALKDQTYFLWRLSQQDLSRTLFPLGEFTKAEVRKMALERGFEKLSQKRESQEICFIPGNDYRHFLSLHVADYSQQYGKGYFVDASGSILGEHAGYPNYTIGQRKGLGISLGVPMFVTAILPNENKVILGTKEELQGRHLWLSGVNLMKYGILREDLTATVKIRYRNAGGEALLYQEENGIGVSFQAPVDAITPGQSAVFYENDDVVGGGIINQRPD